MRMQFEKLSYLKIKEQPLAGTTFSNWMRVLRDNQFHISWPYLPKALYVSIVIAALSPLRFREQRFCNLHCRDVSVPTPLFIIGHWRSGTTFLHYLMGKDPDLTYVSTMQTLAPHVFLTGESFLSGYLKNSLPSKRPMDNLEMEADLPYEDEYAVANMNPYSFYHGWYFPQNILSYFRKYVLFEQVPPTVIEIWKEQYLYFLKKIAFKYPQKRIVLKSLVNTAKIKQLLELFPDAQFIHIHRNPYRVYKSTWKLYLSILPLFSLQHIDHEEVDEAILRIYHDLFKQYLKDKSHIPPENLIELSFEDFITDPLSHLKTIYDTFELQSFSNAEPYFKRYIQHHHNYQKNKYILSKTDKEKVRNRWGFAFEAFGYQP